MVDGHHPIYSKFHLKFESTKYTDRWTWSESQHLIIIFLDAWHCSVLCHCLHYIVFDRRWFLYIHLPSPKCSQIMKVRGMSKAKAAENGPKGKNPMFFLAWRWSKKLVGWWMISEMLPKSKTHFQVQSFITPAHFTLQMICEMIFSYLIDIFYLNLEAMSIQYLFVFCSVIALSLFISIIIIFALAFLSRYWLGWQGQQF